MSQVRRMLGMLIVASLAIVVNVAYSEDKPADGVKERIAPVGKVCMSGEPCAAAPAAPASAGPKSGKDVYGTVCTTCHATGLLSAPKYGSATDWAPRVSKGLETLYTHAIAGFNAMPPKGTCANCSDDEIKAAVKYMVDSAK